ncbi:hypothetical protein LEP1GSC005_1121 [Leptospira santarosai str. ST188]|nr:hypothetical protein LEP1GSC005_1121 [Leptospira santarosai str. ST188]EMO70993.1 hypothetical protein LEP1GSC130_1505 [Leptospira santarosai str. 200403458]EMO99949.1 hypothetical protein LEP1GSC120_2673 [Leptospira santarosai str. 200702252]
MGTPTFSGFGFKMNVQLERHLEMSEPHILFYGKKTHEKTPDSC